MNYANARLFLYRVLPWYPVGDPNAFVNIHWTFQGAGYNRPAWSGRACISIDECINAILYASKQKDTKDIYVCMSTQRECVERVTANGRTWRAAHREQANAVQLRAIYLDIDVKEGHADQEKNYASQADAIAAVGKFLTASGVPQPTMFVSSGSGGLHAYWTFNQAVDVATWQPLANALAEATRRFDLHCDTAVTVDSARVMRMPDTKHSRTGKLAQLATQVLLQHDYSLDQMRHALGPYMGAQVVRLTPRGKAAPGLNDELSGGIETPKAPLINLRSVADAGCGFIREGLNTGGKDYANPLWNLSTLVSVFTEGGRDDAHALASGHRSYTPDETNALYDRKLREREEKNVGWPSCQSIENAGCDACATCPLKGPDTKPLQFGRPTQATPPPQQAPIDPELPHGYSRHPMTQLIQVKVTAKDGTDRMEDVYDWPILGAWVQDEPWMLHFSTRVRNRLREHSVTFAVGNSPEAFAKHMGNEGIPLKDAQKKSLREFLMAWATRIKQIRDAVTASPFGWLVKNGQVEGFCYAGIAFVGTEERPAASPDPVLGVQYTPKGKLDPWIEASNMVTDLKSPAHDAYIASAFAGPLVRFTGQSGMLISTHSTDSGVGKTTAMKVAQSVWGHPVLAMQMLDDTSNSVLNKVGTLRHLPMYWDELKTEAQANKFVSLMFNLTGGKEKSRMTSEAVQRAPGMWQTLMVSASNDSILDHVTRVTKSTTAGVFRVFEFRVPPPVKMAMSSTKADQVQLALGDNYGQAGKVYAKFLGENHVRVHEEVKKTREFLEAQLKIQNNERFWAASIASMFLGAKYANELKLTNINVQALLRFLVDRMNEMRQLLQDQPVDMANAISVSNILQRYVGEMRARHMLVTNRIITGQGKPPANFVKILYPTDKLEAVHVHLGVESKLMRFNSTQFREWLAEAGYSPGNIVDALKKKFNIKTVHGRIAGGTTFAGFTQYLIELDLTDPELSKLCEF